MSFLTKLKYVEGAIPGKPLHKRKLTSDADKKAKSKKYEEKRPERRFNISRQKDSPWLMYDEEKNVMTCSMCIQLCNRNPAYMTNNPNPKSSNPFVNGCSNFKKSAVNDHEASVCHQRAQQLDKSKNVSCTQLLRTDAGRALSALRQADRDRLISMFRNAHAVIKNNRPLHDYVWLNKLDAAKGINVGQTYNNEKASLTFTKCIAEAERNEMREYLDGVNFFSVMMDGSIDISGDEQETIYLRMAKDGKITEKFLALGSPKSTCALDLKDFLLYTLDTYGVDKGKMASMGSDGASNMVGSKKGLSTLLRQELNPEMVNVHCYAHRLELAFRDVLKKNKLYDKLMTLLVGLYYFYTKRHKNKRGLEKSIDIFGGVMPTKVTGTRWLPHLSRGIKCLLRTYKAFESHLSTMSHSNPKAEGLAKILLRKDLVSFTLFLQNVLDPLMRLSLKLQKPESNVSESRDWVKSTINLLDDLKSGESSKAKEVLDTGMYEGIQLRGNASLVYSDSIIEGFVQAMKDRFDLESETTDDVIGAASCLLNLKTWPLPDTDEFKDFGKREIDVVVKHFSQTLSRHCTPSLGSTLLQDAVGEWETCKRVLYERHGTDLRMKKWQDIHDADFQILMTIVDLLLCIPPTSVQYETTFSQMKLIKTSRRYRLKTSTLNDLLTVKLLSVQIEQFQPEKSVDVWLRKSTQRRRLHYKRSSSRKEVVDVQDSDEDGAVTDEDDESVDDEVTHVEMESEIEALELMYNYKDDNDYCEGFLYEDVNWKLVEEYARDE